MNYLFDICFNVPDCRNWLIKLQVFNIILMESLLVLVHRAVLGVMI